MVLMVMGLGLAVAGLAAWKEARVQDLESLAWLILGLTVPMALLVFVVGLIGKGK